MNFNMYTCASKKIFLSFATLLLAACGSSSNSGAKTGLNLCPGCDSNPDTIQAPANYAILAKSGIDDVGASNITGNMGASPVTDTAITGFALTLHSSGDYSTAPNVDGRIYAKEYSNTEGDLGVAILNMEAAYTDAAGRTNPDHTELHTGLLGGKTLSPGLYKWGTNVLIDGSNLTLNGGPNDIWIFQIAQSLTMASALRINLTGGAQAKNIYWQVAGNVSIGTTSHFEGVILCATEVTFLDGTSINGNIFAQTAVNLSNTDVVKP